MPYDYDNEMDEVFYQHDQWEMEQEEIPEQEECMWEYEQQEYEE